MRCLRYADALKSRFLAGALAAGPPPTPDPQQVARLDTLSAEIDALRRSHAMDSAELSRKVAERAAVLERMRIEREPLATPDFDIAAVLTGLQTRGQAALQLYLVGSRVVAVLLHNGKLQMGGHELSEATSAELNRYDENLRAIDPEPLSYDPGRRLELTRLVPRQVVERALTAKALLVSPHGVLNTLPWAALRHEGGRQTWRQSPFWRRVRRLQRSLLCLATPWTLT
jgi:hypothetical protein